MEYFFPIIIGSLAGYFIKCIINWIDIDNYKINKNNLTINFRGAFLPRRGRINCSLNDNGKWRWFGVQFIVKN